MHILFIGQQSLTSPSGLGRHWPLAKVLAQRGHQVRILTLHHDFAHLGQYRLMEEGVDIWYVGQMQVLKRDGQKVYFSAPELLRVTARSVIGLRNAIAQSVQDGFHIIHLMKPQPVNGLAWLWYHQASFRKPKPSIQFFLDCDDHESGSIVNRHPALQLAVHWFEEKMPSLAQAITYNTAATQERMISQGTLPQKLFYLPNGIDQNRFTKRNKALEAMLRQRFTPNGEPLLLYVGTLSITTHDVDLLLQAFSLVHQQRSDAQLLLVGGGEDRVLLQQQAYAMGLADATHFIGPVDANDVPSYLRIAHLSIEPTRRTAAALGRSPLKIVESFAAGTPLVCGAVGERARTLKSSENIFCGILVKPDDAEALAMGILLVLTQPRLAAQLQTRGLERAKDFYWDQLVPTVEAMYCEVC